MDNLLKEYKNTDFNPNSFLEDHEDTIKLFFNRGAKVEIQGDSSFDDGPYSVQFIDRKSGKTLCENIINKNHWLATNEKYYMDWHIKVFQGDKLKIDHILDLSNQSVLIVFDTKSVGDTIAWLPQAEEFRRLHNCKLHVATFFNHLFKKSYPELNFIEPNGEINHLQIKYQWWVGVYMNNVDQYHRRDWRTLPLIEIATDQLGLDPKEIKCKLDKPSFPNKSLKPKGKYVCISTASTAGLKHWQNEEGWQRVVDHLNSLGYKVVIVQRERLPWMDLKELKGVVHPFLRNIEDAITLIRDCDFFIGLSSGMSWVAWALDKKVVLISGFTKSFHEFSTPYRVINEDVCNGCWHDTNYFFDRSDWNWCPKNKKFECSKSISADKVIKEIDKIV